MKTVNLIKAMNDLITRPENKWDLFVTVTFFKQTCCQSAKKRFKYFLKHLNRKKKFYEKYVKIWMFFEKDGFRRGVHIHALLSGINSMEAVALEKECIRAFGQSKVLPYQPNEGASFYLARKYPIGVLEDYDYCKINSRIRIKGVENEKSRNLRKSQHGRSNISSTVENTSGILQEIQLSNC